MVILRHATICVCVPCQIHPWHPIWEPQLHHTFQVVKDSLYCLPMHWTGFCWEAGDGLDGEDNVRAGSECHVHKQSDCLMIRHVSHVSKFGSCQGRLCCGKSDVCVHGDRINVWVLGEVNGATLTKLAMVQSSSGSGCFSRNLNSDLEVWFRYTIDLDLDLKV